MCSDVSQPALTDTSMLSVILYCYVNFCPIHHSDRFPILCLPYVNKFNTTGSQGFYVESAYRSRPIRVAAAGTHCVESFRLVNHQLTASPKHVSRQSWTCLVSSPYPSKDLYKINVVSMHMPTAQSSDTPYKQFVPAACQHGLSSVL